jgi:REP element-mobilizing transposase RayT
VRYAESAGTVDGMGRPRRIEVPGGMYHVATRGDNKESIVRADAHRALWVRHVTRIARDYGWIVFAWCLMTNHYHLVLQICERGLSNGMRDLNGPFAREMNVRLGRCDHWFGKRFWSEQLEDDAHLLNACRHTDLNPCEAAMCEDPGDYVWSGYRAAVGAELPAPFHDVDELHRLCGAATPQRGATAYETFVLSELHRRRAADGAAVRAAA